MSTNTLRAGQRTPVTLVAGAVLAAAAIGVLSAQGTLLAVAAFVAVIAVPTAILRPKVMAHVLVVTIFAQYITVSGVTVQRLAAPLALIAALSQIVNHPVRLPGAMKKLFWVGCYAILALASLTWTQSPSGTKEALASLAIALTFLLAFAVLVRTKNDVHALLWTVAMCSLVLALWWIASYFQGIDRARNKAGDPNFNAMLLTMAVPLIVVLTTMVRSAAQRAGLFGLIGVVGGAVVTTLSRGGLVGLLAISAAVLVLPARSLFRSRAQKVAFVGTAAVGMAVLLILTWASLAGRFQENSGPLNRGSGREDLWAAAMTGYRAHPLTGIGYGAFLPTSQELLASTPGVNLRHFLNFTRLSGQEAHSAYLGSLAELGPFGLAFFLAILAGTTRSLVRTGRLARDEDDETVALMSSALAVSLLAFVVSSVFLSSETSGRGLWMIIGLSLVLPTMISPRDRDAEAEPDDAEA